MHMPAVAARALPITNPDSLVDVTVPVPTPGPNDLLVEVRAVSVNPIDIKLRNGAGTPEQPLILGFDAVGTVVAVGEAVEGFSVGDEVWHSGDRTRPGTYARFTLIDHRVAAMRPGTLAAAQAAALPLTAITASEALREHMRLGGNDSFLMIGGAGGVGSIAIQLATLLTDGPVVATASHDESADWCLKLGADAVIDHRRPLPDQAAEIGVDGFDGVLSPHTVGKVAELAEVMAPFGHLVTIDGLPDFDILAFKPKSLTVTSESMFTRTQFHTPDIAEQGRILARVADLVDSGKVKTTMTTRLQGINAATLRKATEMVEQGHMIGKVVVEADAW